MDVRVELKGGHKYKHFLKQLSDMRLGVKAGIPKGATNPETGDSIPYYAAINEFGMTIPVTPKMRAWMHYQGIHLKKSTSVIKIPARPFLRDSGEQNLTKWVATIHRGVKGHADSPNEWRKAMNGVGEVMKLDIIDTIQNGSFAANAPMTVRMKEAKGKTEPDHPLIDTGYMQQVVAFEVVNGK